MKILGISAFYHDSAAALIDDGKIVAAAQEERFTRKKHDERFPVHAIEYCLTETGTSMDSVDYVVFYEKPLLKFERLMETYLAYVPAGFSSFRRAIPVWVKEKLFLKREILTGLKKVNDGKPYQGHLAYTNHHESHAASAFFPGPFEEAAVVCVDGVGGVDDDFDLSRQGKSDQATDRAAVSPFTGFVVFGFYLLHRISGQ